MPDPSIDSLRAKSEVCRAELKETIGVLTQTLSDTTEEIKTTFSPGHLKEEARAYAKEKRSKALEAVKRNVASHPLQALAIGAIAAYPLLGLVRRVPVPLVLIGAGLWLSRNGASPRPVESAGASENESTGKGEEGQSGRSTLREMQMAAAQAGAKTKEALAAGAAAAVSGASSAAADVAQQASKASEQTRAAIGRVVERNPLLVGGVALAVGGFIAASLPASRVEETLLNKAGGSFKDAGRKAAAEAIKGAKEQASEIAQNMSAAARREGLTQEALDEAVGTATDKVASVVDRAVDAAIGAEPAERETEDRSDGEQNARF